MAAKYWLKLYYDMLDDPKIGKLRAAVRWRFIECLLVAGECDDDGYMPDIQEYAWRVRADPETVETDFVSLAESGLLSQDGGRWMVTNFAKRQAAVGSTERWRRWRDRKRKQEYDEQQTDFQRNQTETPTYRLTDTDKIRTDKIRTDNNSPTGSIPLHSGTRYELPDSQLPNAEHIDKRQSMITALSKVVREKCAIGVNESKFESVADALIDDGITEAQVAQFGDWWIDQEDRPYTGKPWLKSLLNNISNVTDTGGRKEFGWDAIQID